MNWTADEIPDLKGKTVIITGANSGLGYQASLELAKKNARVIMAVRNRDCGKESCDRIISLVPDAEVIVMKLDLSNIDAVKNFTNTFLEEFERLDILINNAGVMSFPYLRTTQDFELHLGTNHLGHFVLTALLMGIINKTRNSRIINVTSLAYRMGRINFEDINLENSYSGWRAYGQSKLANLLFTIELDRRLKLAGKNTITAAAHPGYISTNLLVKGAELGKAKIKKTFFRFANHVFGQSVSRGVLPVLFAATSPFVKPGGFYGPGGLFHLYGRPAEEIVNSKIVDPMEALKLWEVSEKLTGMKFSVR